MNDTNMAQADISPLHMGVETARWQSTELANPHASGMESLHPVDGPKETLSNTAEANIEQRRKVGRPIIYTGNFEDPGLTSAERRALRRRVANRESARRARGRRQELSDQMTNRVCTLEEVNTKLLCENEELQRCMMQLKGENKALQDAQAERSAQSFAATSVSMHNNSVCANSVNLIGTNTAGQGLHFTAPADMDETFMPATFLEEDLCLVDT